MTGPSAPDSSDRAEKTGDRIAKVIARAGICSRREAEARIVAGRVTVNGKRLETPACIVGPDDVITIDNVPLPTRERTRLWLYHKTKGLVTTNNDPEGRRTIFQALPADLPRVVTVGRLDINTEGLLILTNDGGLSRVLELPDTGWLRRYRVRAFGSVREADLARLAEGVAVDGVLYGPIEATIDQSNGPNMWLTIGLREGKNREVKNVLSHIGLTVNRLIRVSFGPFQLGDLTAGEVQEIRPRVLKDQLGTKLIEASGASFEEDKAPERLSREKHPGTGKTRPTPNRPTSSRPPKTGNEKSGTSGSKPIKSGQAKFGQAKSGLAKSGRTKDEPFIAGSKKPGTKKTNARPKTSKSGSDFGAKPGQASRGRKNKPKGRS